MTDRSHQLHDRSLVFVAHDHRPIAADVPLMVRGGVTAKVYQVTLDVDLDAGFEASSGRTDGWNTLAHGQLSEALAEIAAAGPRCRLVTSCRDIEEAKREGRVGIVLGAEGTRWLGQSLDPLHAFYERGLRELQLCWAFRNAVVPESGLSDFGRRVVRECEQLGIVVDLTHAPPQAFDDAIAMAQKPMIVSHGTAAGLTVDLADEQIRRLASTGGVLGIHFFTSYLGPDPTPEGVAKQVLYVADLVGIEHVALGVDLFPTDGPWTRLVHATGTPELKWAIEDLSQMPRVTRALLDAGLSEDDVAKVLGLNLLRVYREVIG